MQKIFRYNHNDGEKEKIHTALSGEGLSTLERMGIYTPKWSNTNSLQLKASKGSGYKYWG